MLSRFFQAILQRSHALVGSSCEREQRLTVPCYQSADVSLLAHRDARECSNNVAPLPRFAEVEQADKACLSSNHD